MAMARTVRLIEIVDILGVTHQRTSVIVRQPGFPKPVGHEGQSRVWDRREVQPCAQAYIRRPGQETYGIRIMTSPSSSNRNSRLWG